MQKLLGKRNTFRVDKREGRPHAPVRPGAVTMLVGYFDIAAFSQELDQIQGSSLFI